MENTFRTNPFLLPLNAHSLTADLTQTRDPKASDPLPHENNPGWQGEDAGWDCR